MSVVNVQAVASGAKYCKCGGMFVQEKGTGLLMSNPPQVQLECYFCGNKDTVVAPYNVDIQFRVI